MTNATLRGKPDAGNPHVRFDEGEVASAKPRRGSLLYKRLVLVTVVLAFAGAEAGIKEMKEAFEKNLPKTIQSAKLTFTGVDAGYDVYNCSIPFVWNGVRYIFGRVEPHDRWASSKVMLFRASGRDEWKRVLEFGSLDLEDPYIAFVKGELIVGGTRVEKVSGLVKSYRGDFYRDNGRGPLHLEYYTSGPYRMKDIRLVELKDGRIGVFSRPRGEDIRAKYGSEAVIGFTTIADLKELTPELVENAPVVEGIFGKDEWGGCNQAYLQADGTVLVAAHLCYQGAPAVPDGPKRQIYCNAAFTLDPVTRKATHIRLVATRKMYPACEPKVQHLDDCVFTSGFVFNGDGTADIYTGLCDAAEGRVRVRATDITACPPEAVLKNESSADPIIVKPRDPTTVWNREILYKKPKSWDSQGPFKGEATPVFLEGEPYQGRPTKLFAYYGVPTTATKEKPAPAIVLIHGGAGTAYPEWVRLWVRRGYAAICVDTCGALPVFDPITKKWMANPYGGPRGWGRVDAVNDPEKEQWVYHAIAAVMRSHSFLRSLPNVDVKNVGVTGISWGGFLTCIAAAADDRFAYAMPVYGCGFNYERGGLVWNAASPDVAKWAKLWEPVAYLPFVKCPMLWVDGTNDFAFSLDRVRRSAALAPVAHAFATRLRMVHGHGPVGEAPAELLAFADHYARGKADVVRVGEGVVKDGVLAVKFDANGRKVVRAELLATTDGKDVKWDKRLWNATPVKDFDAATGEVAVKLPKNAFAWIVNLVTDDGLVASSPYQEVR